MPPIQISKQALAEAQKHLRGYVKPPNGKLHDAGEKGFRAMQDAWEKSGLSAIHYLPKDIKRNWLILGSVLGQINEILVPVDSGSKDCEGEGGCEGCENQCQSNLALPQLTPPPAGPADACDSGCASEQGDCSNISLKVALSILDHLFKGEATGRADLDSFYPLIARYKIKKASLEAYCNNHFEWLKTSRIVSWEKLSSLIMRRYAPFLEMFFRTIPSGVQNLSNFSEFKSAIPMILGLQKLMADLKEDLAQGHVRLAQEDLAAAKISEKRLKEILLEKDISERSDEDQAKLEMLLAIYVDRFNVAKGHVQTFTSLLPGHQLKLAGWVWLGAQEDRFNQSIADLLGEHIKQENRLKRFFKNTWRAATG